MPTSNWQNIGESIDLIRTWMPQSVLDVGCGFGRWGFLCREFLDVWEGRCFKPDWKVRIEAIEGFDPYLSPVQRHLYDAIHVGDARAILPGLPSYDLIILGDVFEHFARDEAKDFLATCRAHLSPNGHVLLHVPLGEDWEQGDGPGGNAFERHLSAWTLDQLEELGASHTRTFRDYVGREFAVVVYEAAAAGLAAPGDPAGGGTRLSIAFATQEWPVGGRSAGGIGVYVAQISRALARRGHLVHVVTCAHPDAPPETTEDGVSVHRVAEPAPNAKDPASLIAYSRAVAARLRTLDAEHALDVVEFTEWAAEGWAFHPRRDQALVVRLQAPSCFVRRFEYADGTTAERRVDELERWAVERADLVTAPSRLIAEYEARQWSFDAGAVVCVPNGVDTSAFRPQESHGAATPAGAAAPVVLCVNRLSPLKGPEVFVKAAARVHREIPSARFRMVGRVEDWDGEPADGRLRRLAEELGLPADRLEILGPAGYDELPAVYAAADVCVNPSFNESYSITSAEALASGKPCVLSRAMGIVERLADGEDCILADAGDDEAFARGITRLLGDPELRRRMGEAARRTAEGRLAIDPASVEAAYRRVLASVRAREPLPRTRLNVAILTHNALDWTKRCLESLARHTKVPHHVFVLDNASTDGTREWLAGLGDGRVHVTLGERNLGVPKGRNHLLRTILPYLRDDAFVVFLDNDVEVTEGWYEPYLGWFDGHPRAGIAGENGHPIVVHESSRELLPVPEIRPAPVDVVSGFSLWVRAACARETGVFDEKLGLFWHEDDDYGVRAIMHGWEVAALASGRIIHHEHKSGAALPAIATGGSPENQRYLAAKWRSLGVVADDGRILRGAHDETLGFRTLLARRLGRVDAIPQDELDRAARDLSALLRSPDVMEHVESRTADLSPTLRVLLDANVDIARKQGNAPLVAALVEVRELVRRCRYSALLRPHVDLPDRPAGAPRGASRLSKLCDARDWDAPQWRALASAAFGDAGGRNWYARHRSSGKPARSRTRSSSSRRRPPRRPASS
jgi:glycosyltransferase involved in cell wall biosynthesis/GT2 family glycosyltransferase